ncbi:2'-5' RNA ligase family protein [Saccharothrix longispora]|uniref:2'-5' RNA ligase family protein n=1 Tax=Saccharothrix longispora TaxID=33920 RepID=UPI0028FD7308|nr:2'-5' RNA ligase family protein [Saccharothrix longispora]MBY8848058.1 2'-5' RNA ligase family protein [Saccharothrix sp. MB29]MDU0288039.1 2'-5' RNA ligase family protein [Saccharothrix longispora]
MRPVEDLGWADETAVIVPVPAADQVVGRYRRRLAHSAAWGVPAHVTVLYPFVPPHLVDPLGVVEVLGGLVEEVEAFECAFRRTAWFGEDVLWLAPEPASPFRRLTEAVWGRFPEYPPYGGAVAEAVPHLTVGSTPVADVAALRDAERELAGALPFRAEVGQVRLIAGGDRPDSWRTVAEWDLRPRGVHSPSEVE